jgi:integral membrane sensor domain MASE1
MTQEPAMSIRALRYLAGVLVLAAIYLGAAKLGFTLDSADSAAEQVTVVWPPTGISLACLLVFGFRLWPGVALGAFLANATSHEPMLVACGIAVGNTLEAVLGAWLLRRVVGFRNPLERLKDVLGLVVLAAGVSTTVSATIGAACLCLGGLQPDSAFGTLWWTWWLGDAMGDLVMAPVLLTWATWARIPWDSHRQAESVAFVVVLAMVSIIVFSAANPSAAPAYPQEYTIFPFLIWGALRLGQRGVATGTLVALVIAIVATINKTGPFAGNTPHQSLVQLHFFMAVLVITSLLLGAATCERRMEERRRAVGYTITAVLAEAPSLPEAAPRLLQVIGETLDWDVGALWTLDRQAQVLRCVEIWHAPGVSIAEFETATRVCVSTRYRSAGPGLGRRTADLDRRCDRG